MIWNREHQVIFESFCVCLRGLKDSGWINLTEHEQIIKIVQDKINKLATDED